MYDFQKSALELYARHSLTVVRYGAELLRDLASLPPPPETGGVEIVRWHPARSEEARVSQNEAFADHWGSTPRDAAAWEHEISSFGTRLDLSSCPSSGGSSASAATGTYRRRGAARACDV